MSINISFDAAELTAPEAYALQAFLKTYDHHATLGQIEKGVFEEVTPTPGEVQVMQHHLATVTGATPVIEAARRERAPEDQALKDEALKDEALKDKPEAPKAKRGPGRPKKEEAAQEPVDPTPGVPASPAETPVTEAPAPATPSDTGADLKPVPLEELRAALMAFTKAKGMPAGLTLLNGFGAARISDVADFEPAKQHKIMQKLGEVA